MEEIIKEYLKERCNRDPELEQKFNEDQMESCISYIEKKAREYLDSKNGAIISDTVFSWAVEYFVVGEAELDRIQKEKEEAERKEREAKKAEEKKKADEKKFLQEQHKDGQISLFDFAGV